MKGLDFLKKASLVVQENVKETKTRIFTKSSRNPENADLRIYANGSVYPSKELVAEFKLQYQPKNAEHPGYAFDVISSADYGACKDFARPVLMIAAVERTEPKTDLFSASVFDKEGNPMADVLTQGANTFGKQLLEKLKELENIELEEGTFVDLLIIREYPFNTPNNIYLLPKTVSRGEHKGELTYVRRENITLYALVPVTAITADDAENTRAIEEPTVMELLQEEEA